MTYYFENLREDENNKRIRVVVQMRKVVHLSLDLFPGREELARRNGSRSIEHNRITCEVA